MDLFLNEQSKGIDPYIEQEIKNLKENINNSFISEYEIAAQNILNYVKQSRDLDLKNKMRELFTDLLITGVCYYRVKPSGSKQNLSYEVLNPIGSSVVFVFLALTFPPIVFVCLLI